MSDAVRWTRFIATVVVVMTVALAPSWPAWAVGDAQLDRLIVNYTNPGWEPLPSSFTDQLASLEQRTVSAATDKSVTVAARGWQYGANRLVVILVAFPEDVPQATQNARAAVIGICASATGNAPTSVQPFGGIDNAAEGACTGKTTSGAALSAFSLSWVKRNVFVIVSGSGLSQLEVESVAIQQDGAIPASGVVHDTDGSNTALGFAVIGGVAVIAAVVIGVAVSRARKRKIESPAAGSLPTPAQPLDQGWHPVAGNSQHLAYWDGTQWTAQLRWDGSSWIDAS